MVLRHWGRYSLYRACRPSTTTCALLARSRVADRRPRLCLDRPDRPIFQTHPRANSGPKIGESSRSRSKSRRQVRQQRRLNFRDSIGCFETSRLVVPQPCSSPSCHQNPARRPGGQAAKLKPGPRLDPTLVAGLSHHPRASKLVALKTFVFRIYLRHTRQPAFANIHLHTCTSQQIRDQLQW